MTRWRDTSKQMDGSLYIQPLLGVYCSAMDARSALNICEYFNITLFMPLIWTPLQFLCIWGCKSNEISLAQTTLTIPAVYIRGSHVGKWPDLMTSKQDSVSTLGYHWADHTGRPLELQVHWDATGTTPADARTQWCPNGDPVLFCIIGTHTKTTGKPLENHWKHTGYQQFFLRWHSCVHWGLSSRHPGLPLDCHWKTTGSG